MSQDECPVCFESTHGHTLVPCGHGVCRTCAQRWLQEHDSCPLCRRDASCTQENVAEQRTTQEGDHRARIQVMVYASQLRGRSFEFVDEGEIVRFVWNDDPGWLYEETLHLQNGDRITHIDGFDVQNAAWTRRVFERAISLCRIFRCNVLLEGRACSPPTLRQSLMIL